MSLKDTLIQIKQHLKLIYSKEVTGRVCSQLMNLMRVYKRNEVIAKKREKYKDHKILCERDSFLISYPDSISKEGEKPIQTLHRFLKKHVKNSVSGIHILPFFPSSSDGGYAVIDYKQVDPRFGSWEDVQRIANDYRLMVDLILNHVSSRSEWFQRFLDGDKRYKNYFIWSDKRIDMPRVFRPRETPLFTEFDTAMGKKFVWTTFGSDQIDLNFRNPEVLLEIVDVLLFYLSKGVEVLRLDAIGYVWKEHHTSCINLSKTHQIVRLIRNIIEYVSPYALILTEANFPYKDNISYFGEGHEANMVYKFSLPPLVMDAFARRDSSYIQRLTAKTRQDLLFFDFLASHDGIGLLSAREILKKEDFDNLLRVTTAHGGLISYRNTKNNGGEPYELNITYFDAVNDPNRPDDPLEVKRFLASQAFMLCLKGIPGIYINSLLGSRNNIKGVEETGIKRMINRERVNERSLETVLSDAHSIPNQVFQGFSRLLKVREKIPAFHPSGTRKVIDSDKRLMVIERRFQDNSVRVVINISEDVVPFSRYKGRVDGISGEMFKGSADPYGVYFLN